MGKTLTHLTTQSNHCDLSDDDDDDDVDVVVDDDDDDDDDDDVISTLHQKEAQKRLSAEELEDSTAEREWTTSKVFLQIV